MSLTSTLFILLFYFSVSIFVIGLTRKVIQYWRTPSPFKIPIAPAPQTLPKLYLRMFREIFLFESLFKANKWTWFFGWAFHFGLVLLFFRHLIYIWPGELPEILLHSSPLRYAAFPLILGLLGLLCRRVIVDRVRYISSPSDYLMLILLIAIASTGILMTFFHNHPNILLVKNFVQGLVTLNWSELPEEGIFLAHIILVFVLMAIYPISKLLHAPGVFFSPTLNQVDNARKKRHISSWNLEIEKHENGQDLDKNN